MAQTTAGIQNQVFELVTSILTRNEKAAVYSAEDRLVEIGMTSMDMVDLMLAAEATFDIMIPQGDLTPENFRSVASIERLIVRLSAPDASAQAA